MHNKDNLDISIKSDREGLRGIMEGYLSRLPKSSTVVRIINYQVGKITWQINVDSTVGGAVPSSGNNNISSVNLGSLGNAFSSSTSSFYSTGPKVTEDSVEKIGRAHV